MTVTYIISQILVAIAYIILGIGLRKEKRIQILSFSSIYQFLLMVSYILLSGIMGIISCMISLSRNILFIFNEKNKKDNSKAILILFGIIAIVLTIIFYKEPIDIFPCILTLVGIYSYWNKNTKVTRLGNIIISTCWIIYSIHYKSWFLVICESYLIINTFIGLLKYDIKNKKQKTNK